MRKNRDSRLLVSRWREPVAEQTVGEGAAAAVAEDEVLEGRIG